MEQILPALEKQLRRLRRHGAWLSAAYPRLASQLGAQSNVMDAQVDQLVQGVATLHARSDLALHRARWQQDEYLLQLQFPEQLRPFPACRIVPPPSDAAGMEILGAQFCPGPSAAIELDIDFSPRGGTTATTIYLEGDAAFSAALRSALLGGRGASLLAHGAMSAQCLPFWPIMPTGLDPQEAMLPRPPGAHAGLALLREYFTFPARFNLLRLELPHVVGRRCILRLPTEGRGTADACLLEALQAGHLLAGWSVVADLRPLAAAPVLLDGRQMEYLVSVPPELEILSIDRVRLDGDSCWDWGARQVGAAPPGHEWRIAFHGDAARRVGAVASIDVTCTQRRTVLGRPARGPGCRWRLNSLLALEQLPSGARALREVMATQAINCSPAAQAIIGAIHALTTRPALLQQGRAAPLHGTELRLEVDEAAFAGSGLLLFAQVMDRFFGECAHVNTFTRLVLVSSHSGEELIRCKARNAGILLE